MGLTRHTALVASALLVMVSPATSHDMTELMDEADLLFEAQNPDPGNLTEEQLEVHSRAKIEFGFSRLNEHFNDDWPAKGVLDSYLNLVAECPLPPELCEEWVSGRFVKTYEINGIGYVSMRLLSEAVPHMGMPLPHRCENPEASYIAGIILPTETRHMVVRTNKSDAAVPCFIRPVE